MAFFHSRGSSPVSSDFLKRISRGRASTSAHAFKTIDGSPSGPAALFESIWSCCCFVLWHDIGEAYIALHLSIAECSWQVMEPQKFCLKWDAFQSSVTSAFDLLRQDEELVDVTLCCEGHRVRAHRMMLSACSPFFRELLKVGGVFVLLVASIWSPSAPRYYMYLNRPAG